MHNNALRFLFLFFFFQKTQSSNDNDNTDELENPKEVEDSRNNELNDQKIIDQ